MRTPISLAICLALGLAGVSALAWWQWQENVTLRVAALELEERATLEARIEELLRRNAALQAELAAQFRSNPDASGAGEAGAKPLVRKKSEDEATLVAKLDALMSDKEPGSRRDEDLELLAGMAGLPEFQRMLALQQRGKVEAKYADLFKKLKLTPEELSKLQTLLGDRQGAFADALMAAREQGLTGRDARDLANKVARSTQQEINDTLKNLLGPQRFGQLQQYERTAPQREAVDHFAQRLSYTATPLTARQEEQLVQAMVNPDPAGKKVREGKNANAGNPAVANTAGTPPQNQNARPAAQVANLPGSVAGLGLGASSNVAITNATIARAQTFLAPQQLAVLQRIQQEQQAQQAIGNLLRNGTVTAPAKAPKPDKAPKPGK